MRLQALSTRIAVFLAAVLFLHWRLSSGPAVALVGSEEELRAQLLGDQFVVFGLYNSLLCKKCLGYFQKLQNAFSTDPLLAPYRFAFKAVDRALFMRRGQQPDFATAANMLLFYSKKRIFWFHEFTRIGAVFSGLNAQNERIFRESVKYLDSEMRLLRRLGSLEETVAAVEKHSAVSVFLGPRDERFAVFQTVALMSSGLPLFFVDQSEVAEEVAVHYLGFLPPLTPALLTLRRSDRVNFADPDAFSLAPLESDPQRLLRRLLLDQSHRLAVGLQADEFLRAVAVRVPMILYVESPANDDQRNAKIGAYFEFLKRSPKTFLSFVVPSGSPLLATYSVLSELLGIAEDWLFLVVSGGGLGTLTIERLRGPLTGEAIQDEVERMLFLLSLEPVAAEAEQPQLSRTTLDLLVDFFTGKSLHLPITGQR